MGCQRSGGGKASAAAIVRASAVLVFRSEYKELEQVVINRDDSLLRYEPFDRMP
jgi:hypothetical protein